MKLLLKTFILCIVLALVVSKPKKVHKIKDHDKQNNHNFVYPIESMGSFPRHRTYRHPSALFPGKIGKPYRRPSGAVGMTKRKCTTLCKDRMTTECPKGVTSRANRNGVLECVCKKALKKNSLVFPQADYCYSKKGCYTKTVRASCKD